MIGAERENFHSINELGYLHENGNLDGANLNEAMYWYEKSIELGASAYASFRLADLYSSVGHPELGIDYDRAARWAIFSAQKGEGRAMRIIEWLLFSGKLDKSTVHSVRVAAFVTQWAQAAEAGDKRAQYYYGRYLVEGRELVAEGSTWLEKSAAQGYQKAVDKLAELDEE